MVSIRVLSSADNRGGFKSGNEDLDRFFRRYAAQNQYVLHIGTTYVAVEHDQILGFVTVAAATLQGEDFPSLRAKKFPQYPLPALRLARLAVIKRYQGKGVGSSLLRYVFSLGLEMSVKVGCVGILVDAKATAVSYYAGFGFEPHAVATGQSGEKPEPVLLFLPLDRIRDSIGETP
jgi:predicted N-acetyltransferase YhbS